jgi:cytochrome c biogenesis protein CcmG, thiol:disulfide interchange protein DsbE
MTVRGATIAKLALLAFVAAFVIFFATPRGQFKALALGDVAPNFTIRQESGNVVALADFRGKIVVLNFWASWCAPCVEELPSLNRLADRYKGKDLVVLGVSLDEDADAYKDFLSKNQIKFLTLRNPARAVSEQYGTYKLPETYVVSRQGRLLKKYIGPRDWSSGEIYAEMDSYLASQ